MHIKHLLAVGVAVIGTAALPSFAAAATLRGAFALPGMTENGTAELVVRETGPLTRELLIAFTDKATGQPITHFDEELTQELHVLATDSDFSSFVHEDAGEVGLDGRFRVAMRFPKPATHHACAAPPLASNTTKFWLSLRQSRPDPSIRSWKRPS